MIHETVIVEHRGHVGLITLNRPKKLNVINVKLAQELNGSLLELERDSSVRVIIIKGAGRAFCAGLDLSEFLGKDGVMEYQQLVQLLEPMIKTMAGMNKPVIAAVHGAATAEGCGLTAACDLAIASEDAKFGTTAINVGLFCMGPAAPLLRSLGRKRSLYLLLTGDIIDAKEAERIGLVNRVVPGEYLDKEVMELANKLANKSPVALQMGKRAFYAMSNMEYQLALDYLGDMFGLLCSTKDAKEGISSFLEKRKPRWNEK